MAQEDKEKTTALKGKQDHFHFSSTFLQHLHFKDHSLLLFV